jgi:hypothetical protein
MSFRLLLTQALAWGALGSLSSTSAWAGVSCKEAWSRLIPQNLHKYDYQRDARLTSQGNTGYDSYAQRVQRKNCYKEWTILVFMKPDEQLYPYALWDLYELEAGYENSPNGAGSTLRSDVLVQLESPHPEESRRLHLFQTQEVYRTQTTGNFTSSSARDIRSPVIQLLKKPTAHSSARPPVEATQKRFEDFLSWAMSQYPSRHYWVILWGHQNTLTTPVLAQSLARIARSAGRPLDLYTSDACLMQTIELATEIAPSTRFTTGTSRIQSFLGLPYRRLLYEINSGSFNGENVSSSSGFEHDEPAALARMLPNLIQQGFDPGRGNQGRSDPHAHAILTASSLENSQLRRELIPALAQLSQSLFRFLSQDPARSHDLLFLIQNSASKLRSQGLPGDTQDLGLFLFLLQNLAKESKSQDLARQVSQAQSALRKTLVRHFVGTPEYPIHPSRQEQESLSALSLWLPSSRAEFLAGQEDFFATEFYRQTLWNRWLELLFTGAAPPNRQD